MLQERSIGRPFVALPAGGWIVLVLPISRNASLHPPPPPPSATVAFLLAIGLATLILVQSFMNGVVYLFLSWFGLFALIRSFINQQTIGPIVLFVGLTLLEECFCFLPARHYAPVLFGLFPSVAGEYGDTFVVHYIFFNNVCA